MVRQCELLALARSSLYYRPKGPSEWDLWIMRRLDECYTDHPYYGARRMKVHLAEEGLGVSRKKLRRLMRLMGLEPIYPKPRLSLAAKGHTVYPYLLRGVAVSRANQVWATDITYLRLRRGFVYLMAILDWATRYVLSWELSISLDVDFCLAALRRALLLGEPEIFNSDQGSQFTSDLFLAPLKERGVRISMDGRGRALDNVFVERLWRTVKYEEVYLKDYESPIEAAENLGAYFRFYNEQRPHQALAYRTPHELYYGQAVKKGQAAVAQGARGLLR